MGNTTNFATHNEATFNATEQADGSISLDAALTTARIGVRLDADRVEVWRFDDALATLTARWVSDPSIIESDEPPIVPRDWFPWASSEVQPQEIFVTRDAGLFPLTLSREPRDGEGIDTAVIVPLRLVGRASGAVCVYWHSDTSTWDPSLIDWLYGAGLDALHALGD
ncbi:MAG: hypothetical protein GX868_12055 [Actinobacteria bacterium]|nr:hypothetical protein [Actinomycetota bacterium]